MAHSKLTCSSANHSTEKDFVQPIALGPGSASDGHFDMTMLKIKCSSDKSSLFRYQRMKALQVQKEKIVHEMFMEDLEKQKEEKLQLT
mgnify:CR=1 FL=1